MEGASSAGVMGSDLRAQRHRYTRSYIVVSVLWGVFSALLLIMLAVAFVQPQWLGDSEDSPGAGQFGLYRRCSQPLASQPWSCHGALTDLGAGSPVTWRVAAFLLGFCVLLYCVVMVGLLLFLCLHSQVVFLMAGWVQLVATVCILLTCLIYPAGWDTAEVAEVCGPDAGPYASGHCEVRWAYILTIVGIFDSLVLTILAFLLASRSARAMDKYIYRSRVSKAGTMERHSFVRPVMTASENASVYSVQSGNTAKRGGHGAFHL